MMIDNQKINKFLRERFNDDYDRGDLVVIRINSTKYKNLQIMFIVIYVTFSFLK